MKRDEDEENVDSEQIVDGGRAIRLADNENAKYHT